MTDVAALVILGRWLIEASGRNAAVTAGLDRCPETFDRAIDRRIRMSASRFDSNSIGALEQDGDAAGDAVASSVRVYEAERNASASGVARSCRSGQTGKYAVLGVRPRLCADRFVAANINTHRYAIL
jgi:hypothetical protein